MNMIQSFKDKKTEAIYDGDDNYGIGSEVIERIIEGLDQIDAISRKESLRFPPENHYYEYKGSDEVLIKVGDLWQIRFKWREGDAYQVSLEEITESSPYHHNY